MKRVKDIMSSPVFQVEANTTLQETCKLMLEKGVGSVIVTDNGEPKGIFTDRDAVRAIANGASAMDELRTVATMHDLVTVNEEVDIIQAAKLMAEKKIRHLPVTNSNGEIVGMISVTDLSAELKEMQAQ
ncbi:MULTISPECIES: CBS domain-containing protein [Metallosphaera]|uniref:Histidine kinase n=3 Tax=Metallosphaera TaxID=41980 RepID=A0A088E8J9_9CREN|nr:MULTISPECIES: CBS domain-containing protein [Metallosphaera]ABP95631.1 putative signal transduction protein with CBS domains [Metallosphaera sedula DSM 5348]AIM27615.1 putative signal transduction protein with CBS domains [Metallosphaera sedula]AKV74473.1 histidine kinase [Metallosphaera sedula]AKV76712.1 histidine kinase [Metallosphaera sedula]AKV78963.1 histidine kinase [Metallosphaera sedula]